MTKFLFKDICEIPKIKFYGLSFLFLLLNSCCLKQGDVISTTSLTAQDRTLIPYKGNEIINFEHSENFQFEAETASETFFFSNQEHCEDYTEYETYAVDFFNDIPRLNINLQLNKFINDEPAKLNIKSDNVFFQEILTPPITSLEIDGVIFENVKTYESTDSSHYISEIFYSSTEGILRINYIDETNIQIIF